MSQEDVDAQVKRKVERAVGTLPLVTVPLDVAAVGDQPFYTVPAGKICVPERIVFWGSDSDNLDFVISCTGFGLNVDWFDNTEVPLLAGRLRGYPNDNGHTLAALAVIVLNVLNNLNDPAGGTCKVSLYGTLFDA